MDDEERQRELDELDGGSDPRTVLLGRLHRAQAAQHQALEDLRAVMSDAEALEEYGVDITQG